MRKILVLTCIAFSACMFAVPECVSGAPAKEVSVAVSVAVPSLEVPTQCEEVKTFSQTVNFLSDSSISIGMNSCPYCHAVTSRVVFEETHKEGLWPVDS